MQATHDTPTTNALADEGLAASRIRNALRLGAGVRDSLRGLSPAQLADALEALSAAQREKVWPLVDVLLMGRVLVELRREVRGQLIAATGAAALASALQSLDLDKLSDLFAQLPAGVGESILGGMDAARRARFDLVRTYPDDTAGGLMNADALAVAPDATLATATAYLRQVRNDEGALPADLDAINVVDADGLYLGRLSLVDLVSLDKEGKVREVMNTDCQPFDARLSAARVARRFEDEDLVSAPVVDEQGRLVGRITVDDVLDFVRTQSEHATLAPGGLSEQSDTFAPTWASARKRATWLGLNLAFALLAASVIGLFDETIRRIVALAVLMPVVSSMGGVAGTQSLVLVVRGLSLGHIDRSNRWRLLTRELGVAALNGVLWALVVGALAAHWYDAPGLGIVFGSAIAINLMAGVAAGTLIPLLLERLGLDAAVGGEVVLVAFSDTFGFFVFLGLAAVYLR